MYRDALFAHLDDLLEVDRFKDYCVNGLQVEGVDEVEKVAFGVSVSLELVEQAVAWGAQALIAHHGIIWSRDPGFFRGYRRARLKAVFDADLNVGAYHLPLDAHLELGNNACIARGLGLEEIAPFGEMSGVAIGTQGRFVDPKPVAEVLAAIERLVGGTALAFQHGPPDVARVAIVSGGGGRMLEEAAAAGADLYLSGEPEEPSMAIARELGVHFVAGGHYRTETFGVRALAGHIEDTFGLETRFFEIPNPV